jgi:hypothetical protein
MEKEGKMEDGEDYADDALLGRNRASNRRGRKDSEHYWIRIGGNLNFGPARLWGKLAREIPSERTKYEAARLHLYPPRLPNKEGRRAVARSSLSARIGRRVGATTVLSRPKCDNKPRRGNNVVAERVSAPPRRRWRERDRRSASRVGAILRIPPRQERLG